MDRFARFQQWGAKTKDGVIRWTIYGVVDGEQAIDKAHAEACAFMQVDPAAFPLTQEERQHIQAEADRIRNEVWN